MHGLSIKLPKWPIFCQNGHFGRLGLLTKSIFLLTDMMILWLLVWKLVQKIHWDQYFLTLLYYHHTQIRISEIPLYWGLYCKMPTFEPLIGSFWDSNHVELSQRRFQRCDRFGAGGFFKHKKYLSTSVIGKMIEIAYHFIANHANHATTPSRPQRPPRLWCFPCPAGHLEVFNYGPCIFPFTAQRALAVSLLLHNVRLLEDFIKWVNDCDCERKDQRYFERKLANQITFSNVICDRDLAQK